MKKHIIAVFTIVSVLLTGCNSKQNKETHLLENNHEHVHEESLSQNRDHDHNHDHTGETDHNHLHPGDEKKDSAHEDEIHFTREQADLAELTTERITPGIFRHVIKTSGRILASQGDEVVVAATANGIVSFADPSITDGTPVKAGQPIVTISARKLPEGDPNTKVRIEYETALKEYQRAESLVKDRIVSAKDFEQIKQRYEMAKTIYQAQASNITKSGVNVVSPIGGYIKNRLVDQGEYVSVGQPVATVSQNKRLQLRAEVSENHYKMLKNINTANFKLAYDDYTVYKLSDLNGRLLSFGKTADRQSFYIPVTFEFDNVGDIIPGVFAEIFLLANPQNDVISVPISSVTEEQGLNFVYLQLDEEGYKKQEVSLGQSNGERVQILSGLKAGDKIVTKGVYQIKLAAISSVMPEGHSH